MKKYLLTPLLSVILLNSCIQNNNKKETLVPLAHTVINLDNEYIGTGGPIISLNEGIVGIERNRSSKQFFSITSLPNEWYNFNQMGERGQGPGEFIFPSSIQYLDINSFGIYDSGANSYKEVSFDENKHSAIIKNETVFNNRYFKVIKTKSNQYIGLSQENGMFHLINSNGEIKDVLFEYPYKDNEELSNNDNKTRSMAYQGLLAINPNKTKVVYTSSNGEIIHFYNIENDKISLINKVENNFPAYSVVAGPGFSAAQIDFKNTIMGYISISASDKFIYALYCDKKIEELVNNNIITKESTILRVFDWKGNLINSYDLDIPCIQICISNDEKTLWALALTPEIAPVIFKLE